MNYNPSFKGVCLSCQTGDRDLIWMAGNPRITPHDFCGVTCSGSNSIPGSIYDPKRLSDPEYAEEKLAGVKNFVCEPIKKIDPPARSTSVFGTLGDLMREKRLTTSKR